MSLGLAPALTDYRPIEGSFEAYKRGQSRIARRRLYPLTVFYMIYSLIVTLLMLRSRHLLLGIMFYLAGIPVWSLVEYVFHCYVYHGRFLDGCSAKDSSNNDCQLMRRFSFAGSPER